MKKSVRFLSLLLFVGLMCGCADKAEKEEVLDPYCGHGKNVNNHCICDHPYKNDLEGKCHACESGYYHIDLNDVCISWNDTIEPEDTCIVTFDYTNIYTSVLSGGQKNSDVYVVGSMNDWKINKEYKMAPRGDGSHLLRVVLPKNTTFEYKFFIDGWGNDSYRVDSGAELKNGNNVVNTVSCDTKYIYNENGPINNSDTYHELLLYETSVDKNASNNTINIYVNVADGYKIKEVSGASSFKDTEKNNDDGSHDLTDLFSISFSNELLARLKDNGISDPENADFATILDAIENMVIKEGAFTDGESDINLSTIGILRELYEASQMADITYNHIISVDVPLGVNKYAYTIKAEKNGQKAELYVPVWVEDKPFDWHEAVLYFAFTDRFVDGDPSNNIPVTHADYGAEWKGGDFKGLRQKVESGYFDALGVNTLWISSVSMNTQVTSNGTNGDNHVYSAYHSYWPVSTFMTADNQAEFTSMSTGEVKITAFEPHFGSADDLRDLVNSCHKRGIRVLVDFAANHVHRDSPMYIKHKEWFYPDEGSYICDSDNNWNDKPESCWFSQDLPDINYELPEPRELMVEHAKWLIRETNIDGFRVDAVKHMNIKFIQMLRAGIEDLFRNTGITFYTVGETFTSDNGLLNKYIGDDLLHAQFDFPYYYAIQSMLKGYGLGAASDPHQQFNSDLMGTFMGNHDVERAISVATCTRDENCYNDIKVKWGMNPTPEADYPYNRLKLAWTILLTSPGVPLIYYGDEFGMPGSNDPDNRRMMLFDNDLNGYQKSTLSYVQQLGKLRHQHSAMMYGTVTTLSKTERDGQVVAWCYKVSDSKETIIVAVATDECGSNDCGCGLDKQYILQDLLEPSNPDETKDGVDLRQNKFKIFKAK